LVEEIVVFAQPKAREEWLMAVPGVFGPEDGVGFQERGEGLL
jgi:hypothetical protein